MTLPDWGSAAAGGDALRRLFVCNAGFLRERRLRRILKLAGWEVRLGLPRPEDHVGVWGRSPRAWRGEALARRRGAALVRIEDAFLRSVKPGRAGDPPLGLLIDTAGGVHFDSSAPSALETILATHPLSDPQLLSRASDGIDRLSRARLSKYNAVLPLSTADDPRLSLPPAPFVLVVDQTRGDASIRHSGASEASFARMLAQARLDHPAATIVIKTHPETAAGLRRGHFGPESLDARTILLTAPVAPQDLLARAKAVYAVSSQFGLEAVLAGHRPKLFGQPFYAGWGLTEDAAGAPDRRGRQLTRDQLFAAAFLLAPVWYDPYRDRLTDFETVADILEAQARAWREDHAGYAAWGMRAWKRAPLQKFLGHEHPILFCNPSDPRPAGRDAMVWAGKAAEAPEGALRVEDGFLRSRGLGAELVPPLSLVLDRSGIYYDPRQTSDLERHILASPDLPAPALARAERLRQGLIAARISKYNLVGTPLGELPKGRRILVPGQVEDDASILSGTDPKGVHTNLGLLRAARAANPGAVILYKPHPDVEAGLRKGKLDEDALRGLADVTAHRADPLALIDAVDEIWTMTSLLGFEALIRGKAVTCLGLPFYAGWGLTQDLGPVSPRRQGGITLDGLIHAALIDYPRYHDPLTGLPCPPEVALDRLADPALPRGGPGLRALAKAQGWFAGHARLWR